MKRREFIKNTTLSGAGLVLGTSLASCNNVPGEVDKNTSTAISSEAPIIPVVLATWHVEAATAKAMDILENGGSALDAVEQGCKIEEANEKGQSVGKGGLPDRDGHVTLDACIMDQNGNCGAVVYLKDITHAVSVARKVMEDRPRAVVAGDRARQVDLDRRFKSEDLLTEASKEAWEKREV